MTGKLPSVKSPSWSENCPPWNCPTEDCPPANPPPEFGLGFGLGLGEGRRESYGGRFFMYCVKWPRALADFPFCHVECINLTISQQQLQLFINYSNFFKKNCKHLYLQGWLLEKLLSPKSCSFGVLIALIFFQLTVIFGNSYC